MPLVYHEGALEEIPPLPLVREGDEAVAQVGQRDRHHEMILAVMPLLNLEGALKDLPLLRGVSQVSLGVAEVCQRCRNHNMVLAVVCLKDPEGTIQDPFLLGRVTEVSVGGAEVCQRDRNLNMVPLHSSLIIKAFSSISLLALRSSTPPSKLLKYSRLSACSKGSMKNGAFMNEF